VPTGELESRVVVLAKFALGHKSYAGSLEALWQPGDVCQGGQGHGAEHNTWGGN